MDPSEHEKEKIERLRGAMYSRSLSDKLDDRPRRSLEQFDDAVGEDFVEKQAPKQQIAGINVAPQAIGFARSALWWLLGAAIIFFVGAITFFGYYFLFGGGSLSASSGNIGISISGPPQIEGGTLSELQVVITNRNNAPLELAELVVTFPPGTRSPMDFATDQESLRQPLGTIEAGGSRRGTVAGVFAGNEGEHSNVKVELEYRLQGSNAVFVASTDYEVVFSSSPVSLLVEGNRETISGQPVEMVVSVASNTNAPMRDVLLQAQYPFGFKFYSASPAPTSGTLWEIGDLMPGQHRTIIIRGVLTGERGDSRVFRFTAGTRRDTASSTIETTLAQNEFPIAISKPFLGLVISTSGATGTPIVVSPGDTVAVSIAWQNNLPTAVTDVVIVAKLSGLAIDGTTVRSTDGFYRSNDSIVLWDKTTSSGALANLAPGAKGTVEFSFQMPSGDALTYIPNPYLDISVNAAGKRVSETGVPENMQSSVGQKITVASDIGLAVHGLYYTNPWNSVGPMPPKAGAETTYAIVFTVTNTTNTISDAEVTAHLPPYVRFVGTCSPRSECDADTHKVAFNQADGTITWNMGEILPGVGLNGTPPREMLIVVGLTPSTSQIGQQPSLLQNIQLSGIDPSKVDASKVGDPGASIPRTVLKTESDVTTNLLLVAKTPKNTVSVKTDQGFNAANSSVVK